MIRKPLYHNGKEVSFLRIMTFRVKTDKATHPVT
jgi:hypothetical protein